MGDLEKAEELLVELRRVDRLSHPGVIGLVEEYLRCGGDEKKVRQALVDGFVGYEAACAQLSIWLTALKKDSGEASEEVANSCLENLVMQKFDPKLADQIFLETGKAPDWLESMIRDPFWCSVLRKLNSSAKSSAVLDYAIRRMDMAISVSDIGGTSGNGMNVTALEDPHVFSTLLAEGVLGVTSATTDAGFHAEMNRLAKLACFDERSFVYTSRVLSEALRTSSGEKQKLLSRILQEIQAEAIKQCSGSEQGLAFVLRIALLFSWNGHDDVEKILDALMKTMFGTPTLEEIELLKSYVKNGGKGLSDPICLPQVLQRLLFALFVPGGYGATDPKGRELLSEVIARSISSESSTAESLSNSLKQTSELCANHPSGVPRSTLHRRVLGPLKQEIAHACVSAGVLIWIQHGLCENPKPMDLKVVVPYYLNISTRIAEIHPLLRQDVLQVTAKAFDSKSAELDELTWLDIRKIYTEHLIDISRLGIALPVLEVVSNWASEDISLLRNFVKLMLGLAGPPHSRDFASAFLALISKEEVRSSFRHDAEGLELLRRFIGECQDHETEVPPPILELLQA